MSGIRDDNFYSVFGWMLNVLGLKGNELTIFAIIFSFSQDRVSEFTGSVSYLQIFARIDSKQTVYTMLERLRTKKYIKRRAFKEGNVQRYAYSVDFDTIDAMKKGLPELEPNNKE